MANKTSAVTEKSVTLPENGPAHLNISSASIGSMHLDGKGGLVIIMKDGSSTAVENFQALAQNNASIALSDGNTIDTHSLAHSLTVKAASHTANAADSIQIEKPQSGETVSMNLQRAHNYVLPDLSHAVMVEKGGALIITFDGKTDDKSVLILDHFAEAMKGKHAAHLVADGHTFNTLHQFETAFHIHHNASEVASMDQTAQQLANQQPGAGTPTGALAASAGGYGFQSSVAAADLFGRPPIGPIDPTDLAFGIPSFDHKLYALNEDQPVATPTIDITVNGSGNLADIPDAVVKEDGSIDVPLTAQLNNRSSSSEALTVVVSNIPANVGTVTPHDGGVYDAAAGTITYTLLPGQNLGTVITFVPNPNSDVDFGEMHVVATASDSVTGTVTAETNFYVTTDAVADVPTITAAPATDEAGHSTALNIAGAVTDTDGSETITKYTISGLPAGATLNHGTVDANGVYTLTPADLNGLTITVPKDAAATNYPLTVTVFNAETNLSGREVDYSDNTNHNQTTLNLTVTPNGTPVVTTLGSSVLEHDIGSDAATVTGHVNATSPDKMGAFTANGTFSSDGSEAGGKLTSGGQTVTVTHTDTGYTGTTPDGATVFTLNVGATGDYTFKLDKPLDDATAGNDTVGLHFGVSITDSATDTGSGTITILVVDDVPVAHDDTASFYGHQGHATGNVVTGANEVAGGADTLSKDTPNTVTSVQFGTTTVTVPAAGNATIQGDHGTLMIAADGSYTYTPSSANTALTDKFTYTLTDYDGDKSNATLTVTENAPPTVVVTINGSSDLTHVPDAVVKEDHSIEVPVTAQLVNPSSATEALTVVVSGIPSTVGTVTPHDGGVYNATAGTITYTLAPGAALNTTIGFTPAPNSDVDFGSLTVTATAQDANTGTVTTTGMVYVTTDAVADVPTISAQAATDEAGHSTALNIAGAVTDTDGSETITKFTVSGLPAGATLNHGTADANGVYTLTPADLAGLMVTVPKTTAAAVYALTVTDYNSESKLSGKEADYSDNTNHNQTTLNLTVTPNGTPVVTTSDNSVLEHDIGTGAATVTGHTTVTTPDGLGSVTANGAFTADGSEAGGKLTSGGQPVTVAHTDTGYTGTIPDGATVFTLTINPNGDYSFTLDKPLDDAAAGNDKINLHFGISASDTLGDAGTGTITVAVVDDVPVAHNDTNTFSAAIGQVTGNVVTGANETAGGADTLSKDAPNHVTAVTFGDHVVAVPTTGTATIQGDHGTLTIAADGSYTYASTSASTSTIVDTPHVFTGNAFPTDLVETKAIGPADQQDLGELHSNMTINANTAVTGQITFDGAGYTNSLGTYTIAADGTLQAAQLVAPSINGAGATFSATAGTNASELGFFLIANGATTNNNFAGLDLSKGSLHFTYDYGQGDARSAKVTDDGSKVSLVFTDASGHNTVLSGPVYFTTDRGGSNSLNDGLVHTVSGVNGSDASTLKIGFEDLPNGKSDLDYNDTVFTVKLTDHTVTDCGCGADQFGYTLTDSDGDNSKATLSLNCFAPPSVVVTVNGSSNLTNVPDAVVKEDHSIDLPITAQLVNPSSASEALTVVVSNIPSNVGTVTPHDGGVYNANAGTITYTLVPGAALNTTIGFTPAPNSDVDFGSLTVTATAHDTNTGTVSATGTVYVTTDAVVDVPVLTTPDNVNYLWYVNYNNASGPQGNNPTLLPISGHVTDTDGSEQISKITIDLNHPFTNPSGQYDTLADTGVAVNLGTETSHGVYTINVNAQDAANALNGLELTTPSSQDYYWALHNGPHSGTIEVKEYVAETNLSGKEVDYSDNTITVTKEINYTFAVSPLIVDLNHNGFDIVNQSAGVKFDMTNDGLADKTSWVAPTDGFLAVDANHNGVIDNQSELFGDSAKAGDGFAKLAELDSNHDGVIDAKDAAFSTLVIWQDTNQDGVSQANELHSLTDEGISAISLSTVAANTAVGDSYITSVATVTFADGHTSQIGDAWFNVADASLPNTGVREDGSAGSDVLYGTDNDDVLAGHGGNDTLTGGKGADTFVLDVMQGVTHIKDFNVGEGDQLDLSGLLRNFDPVTEAINNFVFTSQVNGSTVVSIDQSGSGNAAHATQVAVLDNLAGLTTEDLLHHTVVRAAA